MIVRQFTRAETLARGTVLLLAFWSVVHPVAADPNFVVILTDDQGWTGTSVAMSPDQDDSLSDYYQTPNLQRLASRGMRFTQGYSPAALCSPTRRSIQFGQTPVRQGDDQFTTKYPATTDRITIPRLLKSVNANYRAAHFGKWDLRSDLLPEHLGYDVSDGNTGNRDGNRGSMFNKQDKWKKFKILEDPKQIFGITDRANQFMEGQVRAGNPFFLQVSHYAVHADTQTTAASLEATRQRQHGKRHDRAEFAAMTADLDKGLGLLLDKIESLGIEDSTYVFYLADNGAVPWVPPNREKHLGHPSLFSDTSNNYPLRGGKWTLFEGGIRVPWIVAGPEIVAQTFCNVPVVGWDLLPTIADLAGYSEPLPATLDGGSLRRLLQLPGEATVNRPRPGLVFHRFSKSYSHSAIRVGDYKLIKFWQELDFSVDVTSTGKGTFQRTLLFNLQEDSGETRNLAKSLPAKTQQLEAELDAYLEQVGAAVLP
jgi:arylsulfatase A-like enzyme